jgi:hypothetical protein
MNMKGSEEVPVASVLACLLLYHLEHSPTWEGIRFSASQEILRILRNPEVHYRIHLLTSLVIEFKILILAFAWRN